jgi:hypothetical protein
MSHFYGTLRGSRGEATRCGSRASGVSAVAASWKGAVHVRVYVNAAGLDAYEIELTPWHGEGVRRSLASGVFEGQEGGGQ